MFNVSLKVVMRRMRVGSLVLLGLAACSSLALAQATSTATVRGTVTDSSGGVLPGATVTLTNLGNKAVATAVTDDRGGYLAVVFPGNYDLKVELSGFKNYEQKSISVSPSDTRGIDIKLDVGQQTETVTVTAQQEVIQTQTGAREGVINAKQIDNLSIMGRSALELMRILPGVVTDTNVGESVGGANNTQAYTVNGIRSSGNTVQLDGSNLVDIGNNGGVMVSLNNDMISEVKVQSSNFAAEYGTGGMNISGVTKSGTSSFHGEGYFYNRDSSLAANDRSNSIAGTPKPKSSFKFPGFNVGGPIFFGDNYTKNHDKLFFFFAFEAQRQNVDSGSRFSRTYTDAMKNGDFSSLLANTGSNLNSIPQLHYPRALGGGPIPNNNVTPLISPLGHYLASLYPSPNYVDPNNLYNYVYSSLEPSDRTDMKMRFDWNLSNNTKLYVRTAREGSDDTQPRGAWWSPSDVALPTPLIQANRGRSYSGNLVSVLSPSMTNEAVVSYTKLTLDFSWQDPSKVQQGTDGATFQGINFGDLGTMPELPTNLLQGWGGSGQVGNLWSAAPNVYAHNDSLQFSDKLTKLMGAHGLKFGASIERGRKQQDFQNNESGQLQFDSGNGDGTGNSAADMLIGTINNLTQGAAPNGKPQPGMPYGEFAYWDYDGFAQDSWKIKPNFTLEYGVRFGKWTNNVEQNGLGGYFNPSLYNPNAGSFLDPGSYQLVNGVCYVYNGCADKGVLPNRSAFALPRINAAWDIDGEGKNVLRGGYGMFFNRNMGNVEYDNSLRLAPNAYQVGVNNVTYDNAHDQTLGGLISTIAINTPTPDSFHWPMTHSFSVSYARRIPWNQVVEASYVGTRGRDLVSRSNGNVMPYGVMNSGTFNGIDLSVPVNRVAVASDSANLATFRPYNGLGGITDYDFRGVSNYNSLQITLSRQTSRRLQYFLAYTYGKTEGTLGGEYSSIDPYDPSRTYGVLNEDRTHILNVSWNAFLPDGAKGKLDNPIGRGFLNGWQMSGISTMASGIPIRFTFSGDAGSAAVSAGYFGTADVIGPSNTAGNGLAPVYSCDPSTGGTGVGEKMFNLDCIHVPSFGNNGDLVPPYNIRTPTRFNHDLTLFKNFQVHGDQKFQFRVGFFNIFNQAFANTNISNDINLTLEANCNVKEVLPTGNGAGTVNACDPTQGFSYTQQTVDNFGKINLKRGHRVIELVFKYYF